MTIKEAVTAELKAHKLNPYPGEYMILDKATTILIAHAVYRFIVSDSNIQGPELMKFIDDEMEGRGYYIEGESHNTPLVKSDPDLPPPTITLPPAVGRLTDQQIAEIIRQRDSFAIEVSQLRQDYKSMGDLNADLVGGFRKIHELAERYM